MIYQTLYSRIIYPAYHWAMRDGANEAIREMEANERRSPGELDQVVAAKLTRLLVFAARNVPFYQKLFDEREVDPNIFKDPTNFDQFPMMTREAVNNNVQQLVATDLRNNGLDENSTGGSTGEVLRFYTDWRSGSYRKATVRRNKRWIGIQPGDREVRLWGAPIDIKRSKSIRGAIHATITRERYLSAYTLDDETLGSYLEFCKTFQPKLLIAYPSALSVFADYCKERSQSIESLKAIVCSAETLYKEERELFQGTFGVRVFDRYGCREVGDIAHEVPGVAGLLVNSDRVFLEIINEEGRPCEEGEKGEVVVTDLDNFGMPLIRYKIGDFARWGAVDEARAAGYPFPVLASVDGRTLDVVRTPSGRRVGGTYWTLLLRSRPGMKKIQVVQTERSKVRVLYQPEPGVTPDFDYFKREIQKTCGEEMHADFISTQEFEHAPGTKFRIVLQKVDWQQDDV